MTAATRTPSPAQGEAGEGGGPQGTGAAELAALAAYCTASDDDILGAPDAEQWASARLLDGLGVVVYGSRTPVSEVARTVFGAPHTGSGGVRVWPDTDTFSRADDTAYLLGVYAFSENYADTGLGSVAHINSIVVPALLVGIQQHRVTGRQALAALTVGYNVMEWAGASLNGGRPRMAHQLRGFRPTPTAGPLAAVAVLGRLAGLSAAELANALGIACSQGGGLRPSTPSPTAAIRIQSGEVLRRAVHSLALGRAGIQAHPDILRCSGGFFPAYTFGEPGPYAVPVAGPGPGLLPKISMKLECTPHTLVTMLDAARQTAARTDFTPGAVESVTVRVPSQHNVISGGGKPFPTTFSQAVGHVPYCIALAMVTGSHLYPAVIRAGLDDPAVRELTPKVSLVVDERLTELFNDDLSSWPAVVEVRESGGGTDVVELLAPETVGWSAADALRHAAMKAASLLEERAGSEAELIADFTAVPDWPDAWAAISAHPLTRAMPRADHDR
jgi:2-methylcitrate dehydratase PrpD